MLSDMWISFHLTWLAPEVPISSEVLLTACQTSPGWPTLTVLACPSLTLCRPASAHSHPSPLRAFAMIMNHQSIPLGPSGPDTAVYCPIPQHISAPFASWSVCVQSLSRVQLFAAPWTAAYQAFPSFTIPQSLLRFMSIEAVMSSNHLRLCCPLLLLPSIFPSITVGKLFFNLRRRGKEETAS